MQLGLLPIVRRHMDDDRITLYGDTVLAYELKAGSYYDQMVSIFLRVQDITPRRSRMILRVSVYILLPCPARFAGHS